MSEIKICEVNFGEKELEIVKVLGEADSSKDAIHKMKEIAEIGKNYLAINIPVGSIYYKKTSQKGSIMGVVYPKTELA